MRFLPDDAADELLVTPPCLAGGGDPRWVTVALHQAGGWRYDHTPLSPIVHLVRPDQHAELSLYPDPDEPWWTILHAPTDEHPAWYARFGARIPVEILAAFTDDLTEPAPLRRDPLALPFQARPHLRTAPAPTGPPGGLDPLEQRVQDLAARRRRGAPLLPPRRPQPPPRRTR